MNTQQQVQHTPAIGATYKVDGIDYEVLRHDRHHCGWYVCAQRSIRDDYGVATDIGSIQYLTGEKLLSGALSRPHAAKTTGGAQ